ncbi:MAG: hypothetical protein JJE18_04965 [Eubacteriaceae bacterium]|nr:hypothetical protein [Eubacteriaceae bacterium]
MSKQKLFPKNKKSLTMVLVLFIILLVTLLTSGCIEKNLINDPTTGAINPPINLPPLLDGIYTTSTQFYDTRGYAQQLDINIKNGIITQVNFKEISNNKLDRLTQEGEGKTWEGLGTLTLGSLYYHLYSDLLLTQNPEKIEAISGATQTTEHFIALAKTGIDQAGKGNHEPGKIVTSDTYIIRSQTDPEGYQGVLSATFKGANLITLSYDEIRVEDGKSKIKLSDVEKGINYKAMFGTLVQDTLISQNLSPIFPEGELSLEKFKYYETLRILKDSRNSFSN